MKAKYCSVKLLRRRRRYEETKRPKNTPRLILFPIYAARVVVVKKRSRKKIRRGEISDGREVENVLWGGIIEMK